MQTGLNEAIFEIKFNLNVHEKLYVSNHQLLVNNSEF